MGRSVVSFFVKETCGLFCRDKEQKPPPCYSDEVLKGTVGNRFCNLNIKSSVCIIVKSILEW